MSSSTRVGFLIPASTDFADEGLYYDNNVTTYEAELPSNLSLTLPGSGGYTGQIRTVALASPNSYAPANRFENYVWNGTAWIPMGAFGFKKNLNANASLQPGAYVASSGTETFESTPVPGFSAIQVGPNQAVRFSCNVSTNSAQSGGGTGSNSTIFNGKFNVFINPNSGSQPTPTTSGAIRLSFPLLLSDDTDAAFSGPPSSLQYNYGELIWLPNVGARTTLGVAAYLSSTLTQDGSGTRVYGGAFTAANISSSSILVETMGEL